MGWLTIVGAKAGKREGYHFKRLILTHLSERVARGHMYVFSTGSHWVARCESS